MRTNFLGDGRVFVCFSFGGKAQSGFVLALVYLLAEPGISWTGGICSPLRHFG